MLKNFRLSALWSLGWLVCPATFAARGLPVFQAIWIATPNFRPTQHHSWSSPIYRRDLRHAVQVYRASACMNSAPDSRRMVRHAEDFLPDSGPEFLVRTEVRLQFQRSRLSIIAIFPFRDDCV